MADGVLDSASKTLMEGGLIDTPLTWDNYAAVIDEILTLNDKTLEAGRKRWCAPSGSRPHSSRPASWTWPSTSPPPKRTVDLEAALRLMQSYSPSMFVAMFQKATDGAALGKGHRI